MTAERFNDLEKVIRIFIEGRHLQARSLSRGIYSHEEIIFCLEWFGLFPEPAQREKIAEYLTAP